MGKKGDSGRPSPVPELSPFFPPHIYSYRVEPWRAKSDSLFARLGSAPIWDGKKGELRDWTMDDLEISGLLLPITATSRTS